MTVLRKETCDDVLKVNDHAKVNHGGTWEFETKSTGCDILSNNLQAVTTAKQQSSGKRDGVGHKHRRYGLGS
jgi:hypothetical protein